MSIENNEVNRGYSLEGNINNGVSRNIDATLFESGKTAAEMVAEGANREKLQARLDFMLDLVTEPKQEVDLMPLSEEDKAKMQWQCENIQKYLEEHPELA